MSLDRYETYYDSAVSGTCNHKESSILSQDITFLTRESFRFKEAGAYEGISNSSEILLLVYIYSKESKNSKMSAPGTAIKKATAHFAGSHGTS